MDGVGLDNATMEVRGVLSRRLRELMDSRPALNTQVKVAERSGVSQSTIQRILAGEVSATIDVVHALSASFGLQPADLLADDAEDQHVLTMFRRLRDTDRQRVLAFLHVTTEAEAARETLDFASTRQIPPPHLPAIRHASRQPPEARDDSKGTDDVRPRARRKRAT